MWIGLVADVPDQPVVGGVEHVMERDRQLDDAKPGSEMTAGDGHRIDRLGPQFVRELRQVALVQGSEVGRRRNRVEEGRSLAFFAHGGHRAVGWARGWSDARRSSHPATVSVPGLAAMSEPVPTMPTVLYH